MCVNRTTEQVSVQKSKSMRHGRPKKRRPKLCKPRFFVGCNGRQKSLIFFGGVFSSTEINIPFTGIELTPQRVRRLRGCLWSYRGDRFNVSVISSTVPSTKYFVRAPPHGLMKSNI